MVASHSTAGEASGFFRSVSVGPVCRACARGGRRAARRAAEETKLFCNSERCG